MVDMSNPHEVLEHLVEMCRFQRDQALVVAKEAQVRANTWADAADEARKHLADFEKWNPRDPVPSAEGA